MEENITIFVVKNKNDEEISSFTDMRRAKDLADHLQSEFATLYRIEELLWKGLPTEQNQV